MTNSAQISWGGFWRFPSQFSPLVFVTSSLQSMGLRRLRAVNQLRKAEMWALPFIIMQCWMHGRWVANELAWQCPRKSEKWGKGTHFAEIQTHNMFKRNLFIRTNHNMPIFGIIPFIKLKENDTQTTVKRWTMRCRIKTVIYLLLNSGFPRTLATLFLAPSCKLYQNWLRHWRGTRSLSPRSDMSRPTLSASSEGFGYIILIRLWQQHNEGFGYIILIRLWQQHSVQART